MLSISKATGLSHILMSYEENVLQQIRIRLNEKDNYVVFTWMKEIMRVMISLAIPNQIK